MAEADGRKLDPHDNWVTLWGTRHHTWKDTSEAEAHGSTAHEEEYSGSRTRQQ